MVAKKAGVVPECWCRHWKGEGVLPHTYPGNKCERCGFRYPMYLDECDICKDMDDAEVEMLRHRHRKQLEEAGRLGKYLNCVFLIFGGYSSHCELHACRLIF